MGSLRLRLSQRKPSLLSGEEWESSQREVVTVSPGVDFPSWRLTLHGHLTRSLVRRLLANLLFVVVNRFDLGEPRDKCIQYKSGMSGPCQITFTYYAVLSK